MTRPPDFQFLSSRSGAAADWVGNAVDQKYRNA
jgi:hypothetical protein